MDMIIKWAVGRTGVEMERLTEWIQEEHRAIPRMDLRNNGYEKCATRLAEYEEKGFRFDSYGALYVLFYDDFGDQIEAEFFNMRELLMCIHSVRLVELESEIVD